LTWHVGSNIDADPGFVYPEGVDDNPATWADNDYRVAIGSPANDEGNNEDLPFDVADLDADGSTGDRVPYDLKGTVRRGDDPTTAGGGFPANDQPWTDMGAYEQCGVITPVAAVPDPTPNNRFLSLTAVEDVVTAIRVTLVWLHHPDPPNLPQFQPPVRFSHFTLLRRA
jgi:hypothetical protein